MLPGANLWDSPRPVARHDTRLGMYLDQLGRSRNSGMIRRMSRLRIWCNQVLPHDCRSLLDFGLEGHELVFARCPSATNLLTPEPDDAIGHCDVAFGQPDPQDVITSRRLKWVHLSSAGYTRYDRDDLRTALRGRGAALTTSSGVYSDPCAQHVLAMMLAGSRRLPQAMTAQTSHHWDYQHLRGTVRILGGESVLIVGFGSIGHRLIELLGPFGMSISALRRTVRGDETVTVRTLDQADECLPLADHVVDLLPAGENTEQFFNAQRFGLMKRCAMFYNVGRGDTVEQEALRAALLTGHLSGAYIDVTTPEPLPPEHPLWATPNCFITPHVAGGHQHEHRRLVEHFLANFERFRAGEALLDRIA